MLDSIDYILEQAGYEAEYLITADTIVADTTEKPKLHLKANYFISGAVWDALYGRPEWGPVVHEYLVYLARQSGRTESRLDARELPAQLEAAFGDLIEGLLADHPNETQEDWIAYLTIGSANMDYRSMVMDGEVMVTVAGWNSVAGLLDFLLLIGLCEWIDSQEALDELLPPPSGATRKMANLIKLML